MSSNIHLVDQTFTQSIFDKEITSEKDLKLAIQIQGDAISYLVETIKDKSISIIKKVSINDSKSLRDILNKDEWINKKFKTVCIALESSVRSIIPDSLYDEKLKEDYLTFSHANVSKNHAISTEQLLTIKAKQVFAVDKTILSALLKQHQNAKIYSTNGTWLKLILEDHKDSLAKKVCLRIGKNTFDMAVVKKGVLLYNNTFQFEQKDGLLYYFLFACKQLNIDLTLTELIIHSETILSNELSAIFSAYAPKTTFAKPTSNVKISSNIKKQTIPSMSNLFALSQCE